MDDLELLRKYAHDRSEQDFATLVDRYVNLVYSAALRQVRSGPLVEEVTQAVFLILAQKAGTIGRRTILSGWLLRTTRFTAANALRREARRKHYEQEFMANTLHIPELDPAWESVAPLLDEALVGLGTADRDAVVLRFFEKKSFREIGLALGLSEDNAQKRVSRALGRLRAFFQRRGSELGAAALASALAANAVQAAPAALNATTISAAITGGTVAGTLASLAQCTLQNLAWMRARLVAFYATIGVLMLGMALWVTNPFGGASTSKAGQASTGSLAPAVVAPSGRPTARVAASESRQLVFLVVDAENSAPVMNARLTLMEVTQFPNRSTNIFATDASGRALLPRPHGGIENWNYRIEVFQDGYVPKYVSWSQNQGDTLFEFPLEYSTKLERGTRIGGKVLNETGEPISGVKIIFSVSGAAPGVSRARERLTMMGSYHTEVTDARGRWRCDHVPGKFGMITWKLEHPQYQTLICGPDSPESSLLVGLLRLPVSDFLAEQAVMVMKTGLIVEGIVLDETAKPIASVRVTQGDGMSSAEAKFTTGVDGRFRFANARPGPMNLSFQAEGHAPTNQVIEAQPQMELLRIVLTRGQLLRGLVVNESGELVVNANIRVSTYAPNVPNLEWSATTDEQGRFEWLSAPVAPQQYYLSARNYETQPKLVLQADGSEHLIMLARATRPPEPTRVTGSAMDAETRQPLANFQVLVSRRTKLSSNALSISAFEPKASGRNGQFSFQIGNSAVQIATEIQAEGYLPARTTNQIIGETELVVDFELQKAAPIIGKVKLPNGRPVAAAQVILCTDGDKPSLRKPGRFPILSSSTVSTETDAEGRFTLPARPGIVGVVVAHELGFAELKPEALAGDPVAALQPWGRVEGMLKLREQSVSGQTMCLHGRGSSYFILFDTKTDALGRFGFEGVPPGERKIDYSPDLRGGKRMIVGTALPWSHSELVVVNPGETTQVQVGGKGRPVYGRVVLSRSDVPVDWSQDVHTLSVPTPKELTVPQREQFASEQAFRQAQERARALWASEKGIAARRAQRDYVLIFKDDGSFRVEDVPPGTYLLTIAPTKTPIPAESLKAPYNREVLGTIRKEVQVPELAGEDDHTPLDLGALELPVAP